MAKKAAASRTSDGDVPSDPEAETPPGADAELESASTRPDFTGRVYDAITATFANRNPTQMFCLCWPGTVLDHDRLSWDDSQATAGNMPEQSLIRTSQILDQYIPPAPITQPDGTRVSDRYRQAITQLGPVPNEDLIRLQGIVRRRLQHTVIVNIDGVDTELSLSEWFERLYLGWARAKGAWGKLQQEMIDQFRLQNPLDHRRAWDQYLQWYGNNADAHIELINAAYERLLAEFPLTEWEDAISILDTSASRALKEAKQLVRNFRIPIPRQEGLDYTTTFGIPYSWPQELRPSTKFLDLLADPDTQNAAVGAAVRQLEAEVLSWMAILPQVDSETVKTNAAAFDTAMSDYSKAQSELRKQYTANAVEAVKIIVDVYAARGGKVSKVKSADQASVVKEVNDLTAILTTDGSNPATSTWDQIKEIAEKVGEGMDSLEDKQTAVVDSGRALASAAQKFLESQGARSRFGWLEGYVHGLNGKLDRLREMQRNMASSANVYYSYLATADPDAPNPNRAKGFANNAEPSPADWPAEWRWSKVSVSITEEQLRAEESLSTYFSTKQWGVNFFIASGGGTDTRDGVSFASTFMKEGGSIEMSFLSAKVLIDRPWMKPEIFGSTGEYFRVLDKPLSPTPQITQDEIIDKENDQALLSLLTDNTFPAYPVAVLLAKDISIRVKFDIAETERMREYSRSTKSESGGFLFFSYSKTETTTSEDESMNSYSMGGELVIRVPTPQIIGYWVQFLPPDRSERLDDELADGVADALGFLGRLDEAHGAGYESSTPPAYEPPLEYQG